MDKAKISCVEIPHNIRVYCPFCGSEAYDPVKARAGEEYWLDLCEHTLFLSHDLAFMYRSARFDEALGISGISDDDLELPEGYDGLTSAVSISGSIKFASYTPPPSFDGFYIGFAP